MIQAHYSHTKDESAHVIDGVELSGTWKPYWGWPSCGSLSKAAARLFLTPVRAVRTS